MIIGLALFAGVYLFIRYRKPKTAEQNIQDKEKSRRQISQKGTAAIILGIGLSVMGLMGGSYQHRGVGHESGGSELLYIGLFFVCAGIVVRYLFRTKT